MIDQRQRQTYFSYARLDILWKYGISYTSLDAEQMLSMIKDYFLGYQKSVQKKKKGGEKSVISQNTSQGKRSWLTATLVSQA